MGLRTNGQTMSHPAIQMRIPIATMVGSGNRERNSSMVDRTRFLVLTFFELGEAAVDRSHDLILEGLVGGAASRAVHHVLVLELHVLVLNTLWREVEVKQVALSAVDRSNGDDAVADVFGSLFVRAEGVRGHDDAFVALLALDLQEVQKRRPEGEMRFVQLPIVNRPGVKNVDQNVRGE